MPKELRQQTLQIASHPGQLAIAPLVKRYESHYQGKYRFARLAFAFDLVLVGIAASLGFVALVLFFFKPTGFADKIVFEADVAPADIVSGAPSTLVIRYENNTGEELRNTKLSLDFPAHFLLQEGEPRADLGTIPVDGTGSVKIRGVMFGDVGGEQTFRSTMTFSHGKNDIADYKVGIHTFSPSRSTLELALSLPEKIVAAQPIDGTLTYRNAGEIDFPEILIEPEWPEGFTLLSGTFRAPAIAAGEEGVIAFRGVMGEVSGDVTFTFHPSFTFGDDRYRQQTLTHVAHAIPLPLQVSHSIDAESVRPGASVKVTVNYANIGEDAVTNAHIGVESDSPFAKLKTVSVGPAQYPELARVEPGASGTITVTFPLLLSIPQSATTIYEHIPFVTRAFGTFDMEGSNSVTARGGELMYVMTSPIVLDSFARYTAPSGDQIGRGPLPPFVGETTKYWVFWNVRGTTNEIKNVRIEGELGANVSFTGRQTVSQNGGVTYDATTNEIIWTSDAISPSLAPTSKIIGIAFELAITPTDDQLGTIPTLLKNIRVTGTDATTGAFVSASGAAITTNLPNDPMAAGNATVE